jgi:hypothetical protein
MLKALFGIVFLWLSYAREALMFSCTADQLPKVVQQNQLYTDLKFAKHKESPPAGLEPAIFGLEVRRLVH